MGRAPRLCVLVSLAVLTACGSPTSSEEPSGRPSVGGDVGPSSTPALTTTPSQAVPSVGDIPGSLGDALALAGPLVRRVYFTDWAAIRVAAGAKALVGTSAFEDKAEAIRNDVTLAGFGVRFLRSQAIDWGFDVFDLDWEALVQVPDGRLWVLRFREGYDTTRLTTLLDERGFSNETLAHGVLRTLSRSEFAGLKPLSLLQSPDFANTGFLGDGRTLVLSAALPEVVRADVSDGPQPIVDLSLIATAALLEGPVAAILEVGDICGLVTHGPLAGMLGNKAMREMLARAGPLHAPNALGIGYAWQPDVHGRIVLGYAIEADAAADLAGRRLLAGEGLGLSSVPYRIDHFSLIDARAEGHAIVLDVGRSELPTPTASAGPPAGSPGPLTPSERLPRGLIGLGLIPDYVFAMCSE